MKYYSLFMKPYSFIFSVFFLLFLCVQDSYAKNGGDVFSTRQFMVGSSLYSLDTVNHDGVNYARLSDLCRILNIDIRYDKPNHAIRLDTSKQFAGAVLSVNGTDEGDCLIIAGLKKQPYIYPDYSKPTPQEEIWVYNFNTGSILARYVSDGWYKPSDNDYLYYSVRKLAQILNIEISFNVENSIIRFDKSKPTDYIRIFNWQNNGVRVVDKNNTPLCLDYMGAAIGAGFYNGTPGTVKNGMIIEARREQYSYGDAYRTIEYAVSDGFPFDGMALLGSGLQFGSDLQANRDLIPDKGRYIDALTSILNVNNVYSSEFLERQRRVFRVFINGQDAGGYLEGGLTQGGPDNDWYYMYQYLFPRDYTLDEVKTIRVEMNGVKRGSTLFH